ncbi:hypothetical protein WR25_20954 [Diploscapter pachys]|uniref:Uncharacterized protein n=1 Tax=Diploscapter pachys TaxID=2018661 RepID=A0A2A2JWK8_9BILA|nr:hypothetical protein WR25_20954 [Diploscapter pachys]
MNRLLVSLLAFIALCVLTSASPLLYRPQVFDDVRFEKRSNAELVNGLIGMDLGRLNSVGKRSNAELVNGLLGMDLSRLNSAGRR